MKRFPNGVEGEFFHQKRVPAKHPDYVDEVPVSFPSGHSTVFAVVDNAAALAWVANLGCIELHTWHSRVPEIELPDYLLIDLDPTTDGQWPYVREIALVVREVMDELGLASFPKTSGATGLHILAPIRPELRVPGGAPLREGARRGGRAAHRRPARRDDDLARRRPDRRLRRLRPERARPDDRVAPTRCGRRPTRACRRRSAGTRCRTSTRPRSRSRRCATRIAAVGDPMRGMWRRRPSLRPRFAALGLEPPPRHDADGSLSNGRLGRLRAWVRWTRCASGPFSPPRSSRCCALPAGARRLAVRPLRRSRTTRGSAPGPGTLEQRLDRLDSLGVKLVRLNVDVERGRGAPGRLRLERLRPGRSRACTRAASRRC